MFSLQSRSRSHGSNRFQQSLSMVMFPIDRASLRHVFTNLVSKSNGRARQPSYNQSIWMNHKSERFVSKSLLHMKGTFATGKEQYLVAKNKSWIPWIRTSTKCPNAKGPLKTKFILACPRNRTGSPFQALGTSTIFSTTWGRCTSLGFRLGCQFSFWTVSVPKKPPFEGQEDTYF